MHIAIISSSVRNGRKSHGVAQYLKEFIDAEKCATVEILDLREYDFPIFHERFKYLEKPSAELVDFVSRFKAADGILIVTPEYNGGYPPALKNVVDVFNDEWYHKPTAIATLSGGAFAGSQVLTSLQFSLWKLKACVATATFQVANVEKTFSDKTPADKEGTDKRAKTFVNELLWMMRATTVK